MNDIKPLSKTPVSLEPLSIREKASAFDMPKFSRQELEISKISHFKPNPSKNSMITPIKSLKNNLEEILGGDYRVLKVYYNT